MKKLTSALMGITLMLALSVGAYAAAKDCCTDSVCCNKGCCRKAKK